jgi:two-component system, sensor histidine kinase and response regulator
MSVEKLKVLVVDDDLFFRKMLPKKLSSKGFIFDTAENGVEALEKLYANPDVELIISDMTMPEMNGLELIKKIRGTGKDVPFIFLTASDQLHVAIEAMTCGASDYLLKDENILRTLSISVDKVLEKHQLKKNNQQLLQDLAAKNKELEKSNKQLLKLNEIKNKFLGMAAHDLRSPLSSIRGLSEFLLNEIFGSLTEDQKDYINIINKTSNEMLTLVNDLLDVSVIESGNLDIKPSKTSLISLIKDRIKLYRMSAEKKDTRINFIPEDIPEIFFDPSKIAQVIDNLVSNAIKFSPPGSVIYIHADVDNGMVKVSIRDEGPGVSEEEQSRLFGEFQRLSAMPTAGEKSTGLGLAIVKKIIDAHQGILEVNSRLGDGVNI